ncbi:MAB_1171c family putative transporter [Streptomyces sp. NPDC048566]|uniref:MAB_1171c family putative transporter n=1 Tax=Streptomyces sp. NPDC048566 TaxID=3365569 RepID=UPI003718E82C
MNGLIYYIAGGILWAGLAAQLPDLGRHRRDPLKWTFCAVIFLSGLAFVLGAPPTVAAVNRLSGVANLAALLTYTTVTAFSAASVILIVQWRTGDTGRARRTSRLWLCGYAVVLCAQGLLFALGDTAVERREDFDTYYAATPFTREMIVLYLAAHLVAAVTTTVLCWRFTRQVGRWSRFSLHLLAVGWLFTSAYSAVKFVSLTAHWLGHRWDVLSTSVAPLIAVGACLTSAGYILPVVGPRLDALVAFVRLRPLFRLLSGPGQRRAVAPLSWRTVGDVDLRLTTRETAIRDGLKRLVGHLDDQVRLQAYREALSAGSTAADAEVIGMAAMVAVAAYTETTSPSGRHETVNVRIGDMDIVVSVKPAAPRGTPSGPRELDTAQRSLLDLSRAVRTPIVDAAVQSRRAAAGRT